MNANFQQEDPIIQVEFFTQPEQLEKVLNKIHVGAYITKKNYTTDIPGYINDMEWNFYDELHRYYVHNTYQDMFKIFAGKTFSVNLIKWGSLPIFIQVANAKVAPNVFYQTMTILGLFYIHQVMEIKQLDRQVRLSRKWYTVSHWIFRPLHFFLNKSLMKLQIKQEEEDNKIIRHRRLELRDEGFCFSTDQPNFINSNQLTNNVIFPHHHVDLEIDLPGPSKNPLNIKIGVLELLIQREGLGIRVWPGICPHEGAKISNKDLCQNIATCPWHGRKFLGAYIEEGWKPWPFMGFELSIAHKRIILRLSKPQ